MAKNRQQQKAKRDLAGAAARDSGKAKGRRDHNGSFPRRRVSEGRAPGSNSSSSNNNSSNNDNDDELFAHPFPRQSLDNFYYPPLALHSYQNNASVFGLPGYTGYYIPNQPYLAPVPQYYLSAQPAAWENCDFGLFNRFPIAGPQQRDQPPQYRARTNGPAQEPQTPKAMGNVPVITVSGTWQPRPDAPEFVPRNLGEFDGSRSPDKENVVVQLPSRPSKTGLTTGNVPTPKL
ncbi:hypothetical protein VTN02DRAFT_2986 [Thermoascus thermophilus]